MQQQIINNFSGGVIDHSFNGRFDSPFYTNGFELCQNFYSTIKGNIQYRYGFIHEDILVSSGTTYLAPFWFNTEQSYLLTFYQGKMTPYSYDEKGKFGPVVDEGGNKIVVETGFSADASFRNASNYAQQNDGMYFVGKDIYPTLMKRTSASTFSFERASFEGLDYTENNFPTNCLFHDSRLWLGGFQKEPTTVKGSESAAYNNFTLKTENIVASDPISFTLTEISDPVLWMCGGRTSLHIGCREGIILMNGGSYNQPVTSTSVNAPLVCHEGASGIKPVIKDGLLFYVSADRRRLYCFQYDLMTDRFIPRNMNELSQTVTRDKIVDIVYKEDNNQLIYALLENGQLLAFLYDKNSGVIGWFPLQTQGMIKSICTVPRPDGKDDLFISVMRNDTCYLERLSDEVEFIDRYSQSAFLENEDNYKRYVTEQLKSAVCLDNASTYSKESQISYENLSAVPALYKDPLKKNALYCYVPFGELIDYTASYYFENEIPEAGDPVYLYNEGNPTPSDYIAETIDAHEDVFWIVSKTDATNKIRLKRFIKGDIYFSKTTYYELSTSYLNFSQSDVGHRIVFKTQTGREWGAFEILEYEGPHTIIAKLISNGMNPYIGSIYGWSLKYDIGSRVDVYYTESLFPKKGDIVYDEKGYRIEGCYVKEVNTSEGFLHISFKEDPFKEIHLTRYPTADTKPSYKAFYITFNAINRLERHKKRMLDVVIDGGYAGKYYVTESGEIHLKREVTVCHAGLAYEGILKTFNIGNGTGQYAVKNIVSFVVRFAHSCGCLIGTALNKLQKVQLFQKHDFYNLPPAPMDEDIEVRYNDTGSRRKEIFLVQKEPLPVTLTAIKIDINYNT